MIVVKAFIRKELNPKQMHKLAMAVLNKVIRFDYH